MLMPILQIPAATMAVTYHSLKAESEWNKNSLDRQTE